MVPFLEMEQRGKIWSLSVFKVLIFHNLILRIFSKRQVCTISENEWCHPTEVSLQHT